MADERPGQIDRWATARAAFVAFHLAAISLMGLPEPEVEPGDLNNPEVQDWFKKATRRLNDWGLGVTEDQVRETAITWGRGWLTFNDVALAPANAYGRTVGASQSWRMFGEVPTQSAVLVIEAKVGASWSVIHMSRYSDLTWRKSFWDQERMRAFQNQFTRKKARSAWDRMVKWLAVELREDFPEHEKLRVSMQTVKNPAPEELARTGDLVWGEKFWVTEIPKLVEP